MTTAAQQLPSNPALDFANLVLTETNNGLELIDILHDIAQGIDEDATTHDRITACNILLDRGLGKCPKQVSPNPRPKAKTDNNGVGALREASTLSEAPSAKPESSRLVNQIDHALNDSLGPAPRGRVCQSRCRRGASPDRSRRVYPLHHPTAHPRHHQQRPDPLRHTRRDRPRQRRPEGQTLPPRKGHSNPHRPSPRNQHRAPPERASHRARQGEALSSTGEIRRPREAGRGPRRDPTHEGRGHTHSRPHPSKDRHIFLLAPRRLRPNSLC